MLFPEGNPLLAADNQVKAGGVGGQILRILPFLRGAVADLGLEQILQQRLVQGDPVVGEHQHPAAFLPEKAGMELFIVRQQG